MATPAAPTPEMTTRRSCICLPTTRSAFSRAARATTAVPCWSSWNTGMSSSSRRRSSTSKHTGAAMSSRLMPPKTGAMRCTVSTIGRSPARRRDVEADREGVDAGELLEQQRLALHHRQGGLRADVAEAEHGGAVGDDGDGVALDREVVDRGRLVGDGHAHPGDARRVGHRQVVAVGDRQVGEHLDLAAVVDLEGAVDDARAPPCRRGPGRRPTTSAACASDEAVDGDVLDEVGAPDVEAGQLADVAAGVADGGGQAPERAGHVVHADGQADGEGSGGGGHGAGAYGGGAVRAPEPYGGGCASAAPTRLSARSTSPRGSA